MRWKEVFKPTAGKIVLTIVLLGLSFLGTGLVYSGSWLYYGLPVPYLIQMHGMTPTGAYNELEANYAGLIIDIVFWFIVSSGIITLYSKAQKQKNLK